MDAKFRFRKTFVEFFRLSDGLSRGDKAKAFNNSMLGHVTVPLHDIDKVAMLVDNGSSLPIVPQPHNHPSTPLILTLPLPLVRFSISEGQYIILLRHSINIRMSRVSYVLPQMRNTFLPNPLG